MTSDVVSLDATELAARIRARELSPVEVVREHRERAAEANPRVNAIVTAIEVAEDHAREAETAVLRGDELGPLHGVPFTVKDTFDTAGVRTTRGSLLFADRVPDESATVVSRLEAAGGIALAKTNTPEFALSWETDNLVFGRTSHPWLPERTAGGSSGGEAAAIAAGLSPLGLGSDLGGSIRAPAHYCGVVGLKPTHGRTPLTGHWPDTILRFMHAGPLARSVRDAALALSLIAGPDGRDWHAVPVSPPRVPEPLADLAGVRILRLADRCFGPVDPEVSAAVDGAADLARSLGAAVEAGTVAALEEHDWNVMTLLLYGVEGSAGFPARAGPAGRRGREPAGSLDAAGGDPVRPDWLAGALPAVRRERGRSADRRPARRPALRRGVPPGRGDDVGARRGRACPALVNQASTGARRSRPAPARRRCTSSRSRGEGRAARARA